MIDILRTAPYGALICVTVTMVLSLWKADPEAGLGGVCLGLVIFGSVFLAPACYVIADIDADLDALWQVGVVGVLLWVPARLAIALWRGDAPWWNRD